MANTPIKKKNRKLIRFTNIIKKLGTKKGLVFIGIFAIIGVVTLRFTFAYAGWHNWYEAGNQVNWNIAYKYNDTLCGWNGSGYFLFGPYDKFYVGPSGMDITMGVSGGIDDRAPHNGLPHYYRIDIVESTPQYGRASHLIAVADSGLINDSRYILAGGHLNPGWHSDVEYRVASLQGITCITGYDIYTK